MDLYGGIPPAAIGRMCIALAVPGSVQVPLDAPLGERAVIAVGEPLDKIS